MAVTVNSNNAPAHAQLDAAGTQTQEQFDAELEAKKKLAQKSQQEKADSRTQGKGIASVQSKDAVGAMPRGAAENHDAPSTHTLVVEHAEAGSAAIAAAFEPLVALLPESAAQAPAARFAVPLEVKALPMLTPLLGASLHPVNVVAVESFATHAPMDVASVARHGPAPAQRMLPRIEIVQAFQKLQQRLWDDHSVRVQAATKAIAALPPAILTVLPAAQAHIQKAYQAYGAVQATPKNASNWSASTEDHVPELPDPVIFEMNSAAQLFAQAGARELFASGVLDIDGLLMVAMMKATEVETDLLRDKLKELQAATTQKQRLREINTKMKQEAAKLESQIRNEFNELQGRGEISSTVKLDDYMAWRQCQYATVRENHDNEGVPAYAWPEPRLAPLPTPLPAWLRLGKEAAVAEGGKNDLGALYGLPPSVMGLLKTIFAGLPATEKKSFNGDFGSYLISLGLAPAHTLGDVRANLNLVKTTIDAFKKAELAARTAASDGVLTADSVNASPLLTMLQQWAAAKLLQAAHYPQLDHDGGAKKDGKNAASQRVTALEGQIAKYLGNKRHSPDFSQALQGKLSEVMNTAKEAAAQMLKQMKAWENDGPGAAKAQHLEITYSLDYEWDWVHAASGGGDSLETLTWGNNQVHTSIIASGTPDYVRSQGSYWGPGGGWGKGEAFEGVDVGKDNWLRFNAEFGPLVDPPMLIPPAWSGMIHDIENAMGQIDPLGNLGINDLEHVALGMDQAQDEATLQVLQGSGPFKLGPEVATTDAMGNHIMTDWELGKLDPEIVDKFLGDLDNPKSAFSRRLHAWGEDGDDGPPVDGTSAAAAAKKKIALPSDGQGGVLECSGNLAEMKAYAEELKNKLDGLGDLSEMNTIRVQAALERRNKFIDMLSNMIKKIGNLNENIVSNLK